MPRPILSQLCLSLCGSNVNSQCHAPTFPDMVVTNSLSETVSRPPKQNAFIDKVSQSWGFFRATGQYIRNTLRRIFQEYAGYITLSVSLAHRLSEAHHDCCGLLWLLVPRPPPRWLVEVCCRCSSYGLHFICTVHFGTSLSFQTTMLESGDFSLGSKMFKPIVFQS